MFQATVKDAAKVPGRDHVHVVGSGVLGNAHVGDCLTDGNTEYEITSIPFVRRNASKLLGEVDICLRSGEYSVDGLVGKTLYSVPGIK